MSKIKSFLHNVGENAAVFVAEKINRLQIEQNRKQGRLSGTGEMETERVRQRLTPRTAKKSIV